MTTRICPKNETEVVCHYVLTRFWRRAIEWIPKKWRY